MYSIPEHRPCGAAIPEANPHAVSVSLPTIADVIGYEEKNLSLMQRMESGYPRFFTNRLVKKAQMDVLEREQIGPEETLVPVASLHAVELTMHHLNLHLESVCVDGFDFIRIDKSSPFLPTIRTFIQNAGLNPSSRKAEDYLMNRGLLWNRFEEEREQGAEAAKSLCQYLADAYGANSAEMVHLANTGMNAVYTAYAALKAIQAPKGRHKFVQLGWLYLDTIEIIKNYNGDHYFQLTSNNLDELEAWLAIHHAEVAGIFTEVPNNPLIQCLDLPRLRRLTQKYDLPLVIDATIASPFNMEVLEYCDVVIDSLTKWTCGHGDVMMGALILNSKSDVAAACHEVIQRLVVKPHLADIERMAFKVKGYRSRIERISENTSALLDYLAGHPRVARIFSVLNPTYLQNFLAVRKSPDALPGLISIVFDRKLHHYYDRLRLAKGPSFGTDFTLAMPYVYMAHYDLLKTPQGRQYLEQIALPSELLRVSVGTEPIEEIIRVFEELR